MPLSKALIPTLTVLLAFAMCASDAMAQGPGRGGRGGPQRGGRAGGADNPQRLLRSEAVQKELEMTDEQIELIKELGEGRGRGQGVDREALRAEMEGLSDEERAAKIKEMRDSRSKEQKEKLNEILLPHQMDRLSQLSVQASAQNGARSLLGGPLAEKLNITDEQKEQLRETAEELQKKFDEEVAKLRAEMQAKLVETLTSEQQAELKEITGEKFTFERQQRGDRFAGGAGGGRDRGGRGGAGNRRGGNGGDRGNRRGGRRGEGGGDEGA